MSLNPPDRLRVEPRLQLLVALRWERLAVQLAVPHARRVRGLPLKVWQRDLVPVPLTLAETGMGMDAAEAGARWLVQRHPGVPLIMLGCAGGLAPHVRALDIVVGDVVCDDRRQHRCDAVWHERLLRAAKETGRPVHRGAVLSVAEALLRADEKQQAHANTAAVAVDMESAAVARIAAEAGCPFAVARVVLDDAATTVAPTLAGLASLPLARTAAGLTKLAAAFLAAV